MTVAELQYDLEKICQSVRDDNANKPVQVQLGPSVWVDVTRVELTEDVVKVFTEAD